ncbi:hypothetical protein AB0E96_34130, partial [Kitasatospora sp. NPDC036755]
FAKNAFPDAKVYGRTPDAQLRLITCGGTYDKSSLVPSTALTSSPCGRPAGVRRGRGRAG